jgi:DNA polymerase-3 subunit beta
MLPAADFPKPLQPSGNATSFILPPDAAALFGVVIAASHEADRLHLCGVHVHAIDGTIATVATNGVALMHRRSKIEAPKALQPFTIPNATVAEIVRMARRSAVTIVTDGRIVEARAGRDRFASKLIDGAFPDYQRVIPPTAAATATVDAADLRAALVRLSAASARDDGSAIVGVTWSGDGMLALCLAHEEGTATDFIAADSIGTAHIACAAATIGKLVESTGAPRVRLSVGEESGAVLRIDANDVTAVVAPVHWAGVTPAAAAA